MDWSMGPDALDVQGAWVQSAAETLAWAMVAWGAVVAIILLLAAVLVGVRRRRFWCDQAQCQAEVEFEEQGLPGLRRPTVVLSCSVFDPPTNVQCRRSCLGAVPERQESRAA